MKPLVLLLILSLLGCATMSDPATPPEAINPDTPPAEIACFTSAWAMWSVAALEIAATVTFAILSGSVVAPMLSSHLVVCP